LKKLCESSRKKFPGFQLMNDPCVQHIRNTATCIEKYLYRNCIWKLLMVPPTHTGIVMCSVLDSVQVT